MIPAFVNITEDGYVLLQKILEQPNSVPADFFFDDPTVDGQIELLVDSKLVTMNEKYQLTITELGRAALKEHDSAVEREAIIKKQREDELNAIKSISESAQRRIDLALSEAESANRDSSFAKKTSVIAIVISIIAIITQILIA